jgi:hypothetical protein
LLFTLASRAVPGTAEFKLFREATASPRKGIFFGFGAAGPVCDAKGLICDADGLEKDESE